MKSPVRKRLALAALLSAPLTALAQGYYGNGDGSSGWGCCSTFIVIPIVLVALNIALLEWVARDAKARGMDSSVLWMLLVFFTSFIGLIIYILSRPKGNLIPCPNCDNQKLRAAVRCPHCGVGS